MKRAIFLAVILTSIGTRCCEAEGLCPSDAKTLFLCTAEKSKKLISICEIGDSVQYRYGTAASVELMLPETPSRDNVFVSKSLFAAGEEIGLGFTRGTYTYTLSNYFGGKPPSEFDHVRVTNGEKETADIRCSMDLPTEGSLSEIASSLEKKGFKVKQYSDT